MDFNIYLFSSRFSLPVWQEWNICCDPRLMLLSDSSTELVGFWSDTRPQSEVSVRCTIGFVIFSHSPVKLCPVCSPWIAAVCPFMWLHQSSPLNPKLWPLSQWGEGLCPPARTTGMICWPPPSWAFAHSDWHYVQHKMTSCDVTSAKWTCITTCTSASFPLPQAAN